MGRQIVYNMPDMFRQIIARVHFIENRCHTIKPIMGKLSLPFNETLQYGSFIIIMQV